MTQIPRVRAGLAVLAVAFGALAAGGAQPADAQVFDPETFTLDNGLEVVVVSNDRAPIVAQHLWYKAGAADEPPGKSGVAHMLEHMMFKGTETREPGEFSAIIARLGGQENAFTGQDYTGYFQSVAREHLETMMEFEADRMENLVLTEEEFQPEHRVVLEERYQRVDADPSSQLSEMASASLYLNHPYGNPIIGWEHEIQEYTVSDLEAFYERWYAPNNAVLIVVGDITAEEVRSLAEKHYGPVPRKDVPERVRLQEPEHTAPRRAVLESPQVQQPSLSIRYLAPSYRSSEDETTPYALQVLNEIIGGGATSRLYRALVVEQGIAAQAGSWYSPQSWDQTTFGLYISPRPDIPIEEAEEALRAELRKLLDEGVRADEVEKAKTRLRAATVYARDSISSAPRVIGRALTTGQSIDDVEAWPERIEAVTPERVEAAAREVLRRDFSVTAVLKSEPTS